MSEPDVVTECDLADAPEKVWKALTAPELLALWLPEVNRSEIVTAEPNKLLRYRWAGREHDRDAAGRVVESVVSFELTGTPSGGTHLRVVHRVAGESRVIPFVPRRSATTSLAGGGGAGHVRRRRPTLTLAYTAVGALRWAA